MNFLFTCGGTAGHINPALAVAGRIKEVFPDSKFLFVGAEGNMECDLVPMAGFEIKTVTITNIQRSITPQKMLHNMKTLRNLALSSFQAKKIIKDFKPDVALGTGGYVCYPVLRAAMGMKIPTALHESNSVAGLTTRMLAKKVDKMLLGFESSRAQYKGSRDVVVTGTPVRGDFRYYDKDSAKAEFGITADTKTVVSVWGSLGSAYMNKAMIEVIEMCVKDPKFRLVHAVGVRDFPATQKRLQAIGSDLSSVGIDVREYIHDMPRVMAAADLVLCRAGASTLSELAVLGKPAILVPSPNVTNNHQEKNARVLEKAGAACVLLERQFTSKTLLELINKLLSDKDKLEKMSRQMFKIAIPDATDKISSIIIGMAAR